MRPACTIEGDPVPDEQQLAPGHPGAAEEYDTTQRQLRGNLPQALVHALMLECAVRLGQERRQPSLHLGTRPEQ
jgi:hypothetical protein